MPNKIPGSGTVIIILRAEGFAALCISAFAYHLLGGSWGLFFILFLLPDISFLGYLAGPRVGAIAYNTLHTYAVPAIIGGIGYWQNLLNMEQVAMIWLAHIGFDRTMGYGLKYADNFGNTHLGKVGKLKQQATDAAE
jgi:hypothetical protein